MYSSWSFAVGIKFCSHLRWRREIGSFERKMGCVQSMRDASTIEYADVSTPIDIAVIPIKLQQTHPCNGARARYQIKNPSRIKIALRPNVFDAKSNSDNESVYIRQYSLGSLMKSNMSDIVEEITIHSYLVHSNIIRMKEIYKLFDSIYVVTEYFEPTRLQDLTLPLHTLSIKHIIHGVLDALIYIHERKVILRNLSPRTILVQQQSDNSNNFAVKLTDFSSAVLEGSCKELPVNILTWDIISYSAPEAILNHPYTTSLDIWNVGVILYKITTGIFPFSDERDSFLIQKIKNGRYRLDTQEWNDKDENIKRLIPNMLQVDIDLRYTAKDIVKDEWFSTDSS